MLGARVDLLRTGREGGITQSGIECAYGSVKVCDDYDYDYGRDRHWIIGKINGYEERTDRCAQRNNEQVRSPPAATPGACAYDRD